MNPQKSRLKINLLKKKNQNNSNINFKIALDKTLTLWYYNYTANYEFSMNKALSYAIRNSQFLIIKSSFKSDNERTLNINLEEKEKKYGRECPG